MIQKFKTSLTLLFIISLGCTSPPGNDQMSLNSFNIELATIETKDLNTAKTKVDTIEIARKGISYLHGAIGNLREGDNFSLYSISKIHFTPISKFIEYQFMLDKENDTFVCVDSIDHEIRSVKEIRIEGRIYRVIKLPNYYKNGSIGSYSFYCENEGIILSRNSDSVTKILKWKENKMKHVIEEIVSDKEYFSMNQNTEYNNG